MIVRLDQDSVLPPSLYKLRPQACPRTRTQDSGVSSEENQTISVRFLGRPETPPIKKTVGAHRPKLELIAST
jgi:hypothetical protein